MRVFDNFEDPTAGDNTTPDPNFPGWTGAELAIWKAAVEWGSGPHGDGSGDPHQSGGLGSGGSNFDSSWQGASSSIGGPNGNVHSALSGGDGNVLAFTEGPVHDGWRIRYYETWTWDDGPGTSISGYDLQGVATHEYGHALGLGHSEVSGATMRPMVIGNGVANRSIESDDVAGIQAIYGTASPSKPRITGVAVAGDVVTVTGTGFSPANNEVWFTRSGTGGNGTPIQVVGLASTKGGTEIAAGVFPYFIPATAGPGDVLVKVEGNGYEALSNPFPIDFQGAGSGCSGGVPDIVSVSPPAVPAVSAGTTWVTLFGCNFASATAVEVDGVPLQNFPPQFVIDSDTVLRFRMPLVSKLGPVDIEVSGPSGPGPIASVEVQLVDPPVISVAGVYLLGAAGADVVIGTAPGNLVLTLVSPDLAPSSLPGLLDLQIGADFTTLFLLATETVPGSGWVAQNFPFGGQPTGTLLHFQGLVFDPVTGTLPLVATEVETKTVLF